MAARAAHMMRALQLAAIWALGRTRNRQRMMAAAHVTARLAGFLFGDCHDPLSSQKNSGGTPEPFQIGSRQWARK
jgi:hypothetical protein